MQKISTVLMRTCTIQSENSEDVIKKNDEMSGAEQI